MLNPIHRIVIIWGLTLLLVFGASSAQGSVADASRISRLESEIFSLRSQINRLESDVARLGRQPAASPSISRPQLEEIPPPTPRQPDDPSLAEQFDNLAILAIELKERIATVEERLLEIEVRITP
ncbi:DUF5082 domain-containing protein [Laspinema olomoucense]|uniref:DUF5082 domain-containing protein n=1 Tax=Laspinema olomoucense TaxID=3231600 RepID=UPI0021BB1B1E|nr:MULTISPECIES: DUF5082 domain-containing protein [unclassified Laspinema]MCT7970542.1 DUF5082 domain-containing protein [Laspinema sp. D3d]MCT7989593.1 DUF5082 domain-containing protein [Laspinema sp. D3a]